jgi:lycopene cyclase domain-containing protein
VGSCEILRGEEKMKEYTILAVLFAVFSFILDRLLKTKLFGDRRFWKFWLIMAGIIFIVNGYLTWRPIVVYGDAYFLGIRLFTIPIEDFLFGFSLLTMNISIWEFFTGKKVE